MALSIAIKKLTKMAQLFYVVADITFDASYPTGGESLTAGQLGLRVLDLILAEPTGGYLFRFDRTNNKLLAYTPMAQHAHDLLITGGQGAADALQVNATVVGKTAATNVTAAGGASNIQNQAAAVAAEVANTTDLSAVTVRIVAMGT